MLNFNKNRFSRFRYNRWETSIKIVVCEYNLSLFNLSIIPIEFSLIMRLKLSSLHFNKKKTMAGYTFFGVILYAAHKVVKLIVLHFSFLERY